jgi:transposase
MEITTIGLDLAKSAFQLHAVDADGTVFWRKKVRCGALLDTLAQVPTCLVGSKSAPSRTTGPARFRCWAMRSA